MFILGLIRLHKLMILKEGEAMDNNFSLIVRQNREEIEDKICHVLIDNDGCFAHKGDTCLECLKRVLNVLLETK